MYIISASSLATNIIFTNLGADITILAPSHNKGEKLIFAPCWLTDAEFSCSSLKEGSRTWWCWGPTLVLSDTMKMFNIFTYLFEQERKRKEKEKIVVASDITQEDHYIKLNIAKYIIIKCKSRLYEAS